MWAPGGRIEWSDVSLVEADSPQSRKVRLATVLLAPKGAKTPAEACRRFEPLIREAGRQRADLVVLPETLTSWATGLKPAEVAEPVPGPSTTYFGQLARELNLYVVAGLNERQDRLVYNVAVLIGPDGNVVGKYRKVVVTDGEGEGGVQQGTDYPVFDTRFGKVAMMICYDGFFPEVARIDQPRGRGDCLAGDGL
jgi:predicted amidohydrolase